MSERVSRSSRLQLQFDERPIARAHRIKNTIAAPSLNAVFIEAIDLLYLLVLARNEGSQILSVKETEAGRREKELWFI